MFAVDAIDIPARMKAGPVEAQVFGVYVPVRGVTALGLDHVILWIGTGAAVAKRCSDLVAIR